MRRSPSIRVIVSTRAVDAPVIGRGTRDGAAIRGERGGFGDVVELDRERARELGGERREIDAGHLAERARDRAQRGDVGRDHVLDAGDLDLDDDARAVEQRRGVDLRERRRGERHVVERREHLGDRHAELGLDPRADRSASIGGTSSCSVASSLAQIGPTRSGRHDASWPSFAMPPRSSAAYVGRAAREVAMIFGLQPRVAGLRGVREREPALAREQRGRDLRELASRAASRARTS